MIRPTVFPAATAVDHALAALAHPVRREIVERLLDGDLTVGEIAAPYDMKKPTISRHLKVLEGAELIERTLEGRHHRCRLNPRGLGRVRSWVRRYEDFWTGQLAALDRFIEAAKEESPDE